MIHTNWASTFSFGYPYGLFESSRYPMFYASDISWNLAGDREKFCIVFCFCTTVCVQKSWKGWDTKTVITIC